MPPTEEDREAARDAITSILHTLEPTGTGMALPSEWTLCVAWVDEDGDTWLTRLDSHRKLPDYRVEGLLAHCSPSEMDATIYRQEHE